MIVDAESVYPAQAVEKIAVPVLDQIFTVGVPRLTRFLYRMLDNFETVENWCVRGNHGKHNQSKWTSSKSTNWDFVLYKALEGVTENQDRLEWNIPADQWEIHFPIYDYWFLATHGDMIRRYYNIPFYGATRQAQRWQAAYHETENIFINYFLLAHFHNAGQMRFNAAQIFFNGSFITDDQYALEQLGVASIPEQCLYFVHPDYAVTARYVLRLDRNGR